MIVITLRNVGAGLWQGRNSFAQALSQVPVILGTADASYNAETVTKILAARRGETTVVPADRDEFREWLNS